MSRKKKYLVWPMLLVIIIALTLAPLATMASEISLFVNTKAISSKSGKPFVKNNYYYVPLKAMVEGMGETYSFSTKYNTATVKKKNEKVIKVTLGRQYALVGNKKVYFKYHTAEINHVFYIPTEFIKSIVGYPVTIKNNTIYVGTVPTEKPKDTDKSAPPAGWVAPIVNTTATEDCARNIQILSNQLGFYQTGKCSAIFNPYTKTYGPSSINVLDDPATSYDAGIHIKVWGSSQNIEYNKTPYIAKEVFKFYGISGVYDIVQKGFNGVNVESYLDKNLTFGSRQVRIIGQKDDTVFIYISKPNESLILK